MSFRRRITLMSATAVAVAVVLASGITYALTSNQLHRQIDTQLRGQASYRGLVLRALERSSSGSQPLARSLRALFGTPPSSRIIRSGSAAGALPNPFGGLPSRPNQQRGYQQLINARGTIVDRSPGGLALPVNARTRALAAHGGRAFFTDVHVKGLHLRILAAPLGDGYAAQFAQSLGDVDNLLSRLRLILALVDIGGIALAALLGRVVAGAAVAPVRRLTHTAEHVARTQDLSQRIEPTSADEIGRMAVSFNAMLDALQASMGALDASVTAQRQLVADASHELRTPVTSLRTNIEILQQVPDMADGDRRRLLRDVVEQIEELTLIMNDLIELARGAGQHEGVEDVRLDLMVEDAVTRARHHTPSAHFQLDLEETLVLGAPGRLDRAINNLLDNAVKYSPPGRPVEVGLHDGEIIVRDHGPGIPPEDLPHVFDRFYRGAEARGRPGSGLGLAIVRQVAEAHGGSVSAEPAAGGGTLLRLRLRVAPANADGELDEAAAPPAAVPS